MSSDGQLSICGVFYLSVGACLPRLEAQLGMLGSYGFVDLLMLREEPGPREVKILGMGIDRYLEGYR